jgi:prefoldin subunit 5
MNKPKKLVDRIALRIARSKAEVFLRKDFQDLADYDQVGRSLRQLVAQGVLIKIGNGLYAKAGVSPLSDRIVPRRSLRDLATEALKKLRTKVELVPSSYEQTYNEGRTTQVPTGRVLGVKGRINRKIGYDGKYISFEQIS